MRKILAMLSLMLCLFVSSLLWAESSTTSKAKRINKAIELLDQGQPIYYTHGQGGYVEGLKLAQTWADYINYEMEHGVFDLKELREFMQGLVDGGPTKSGHRTPAVVATLPVGGIDEPTVRVNYWVIQQVLATGVHGILLCHARTPEAVRALVEAVRYPFHKKVTGLGEGLRGSGSQGYASQIWGISASEYLQRTDLWPLDPEGEIFLGLKIEDRYALANVEKTLQVPGIAFAEWGPGDMGFSLGFVGHDSPYPKPMQDARAKVFAAVKAVKLSFLDVVTVDTVEERIREGVRIGSGDQAAADKGRRFTKRVMPW